MNADRFCDATCSGVYVALARDPAIDRPPGQLELGAAIVEVKHEARLTLAFYDRLHTVMSRVPSGDRTARELKRSLLENFEMALRWGYLVELELAREVRMDP